VKIDVETRYQTFEGWGTSLAWWAHQIGGWSSAKRDEFLELIVDPTRGLGYNVFRYNIGGGDDPSHEHMGQNREMPGFQSSAGAWDWDADARRPRSCVVWSSGARGSSSRPSRTPRRTG
jgi:hypothetical protein